MDKIARSTGWNIAQRRARLLREIAHFEAQVAMFSEPETPRKKAALTRAARCLARRRADLGAGK